MQRGKNPKLKYMHRNTRIYALILPAFITDCVYYVKYITTTQIRNTINSVKHTEHEISKVGGQFSIFQ